MKYCWKLRSNSNYYKLPATFLFVVFSLTAIAQTPKKGDYYFPIRPGEINYLSGSMGELRANHFHAGIDIKTGGVEGLPIYAAADGYVSRIKISTGGYGNAIYIQHPNSTTTVYAHLLSYNDEIATYIRKHQYENQSFEIELFPEIDEIKIKRAQQIGLSGNSGSSGGPHLHFEIRDKNQDVLNPLHFGFSEIKDKIPPTVDKIAFVPFKDDSRINHQFSRQEYALFRSNNTYTLNKSIQAHGTIGIQILAYDRLDGAANKNGISCIDMEVNGEEVFYYNISKFSFNDTRNILAHIDYKNNKQTGQRFQKLYVDHGNKLPAYRFGKNGGKLDIEAGKEYQVTINMWDSYNNHSKINLKIIGVEPLSLIKTEKTTVDKMSKFEAVGKLLKISATMDPAKPSIEVYANQMIYDVAPIYAINNEGVYLWNTVAGLPDSVKTYTGAIYPDYKAFIPSNKPYKFENDLMDIDFANDALFDTLLLSVGYTKQKNQEYYTIGEPFVPLRKFVYVTLKPQIKYDLKSKSGVYSINDKGDVSYIGGEWRGDNIRFGTRDFGRFTILADTVPPKIVPAKVTPESMSFYISDDLSGIKDFEVKVNGEWVLMNYDYKKKLIWSEKLDPTKPFKGDVVLTVTDQSGNENKYILTL